MGEVERVVVVFEVLMVYATSVASLAVVQLTALLIPVSGLPAVRAATPWLTRAESRRTCVGQSVG